MNISEGDIVLTRHHYASTYIDEILKINDDTISVNTIYSSNNLVNGLVIETISSFTPSNELVVIVLGSSMLEAKQSYPEYFL